MKVYLLKVILFLSFIFSFSAQAQMEHCCKNNKKVKIKKQRKRSKGALVGVKGYDDKKALKSKMKELKNAAKARKKEKKLAARNEEEQEALEPVDTLQTN